ncbi:MAG: TIGR01777 family protein [Flavobacterium sp.]|nr:TIGR01777 family protein [Flavobacterium sp.]
MKILITGATGFIGKKLSQLLIDNGINVNYLSTSKSKIKSKPNFKGFYWNPDEGKIDENCLIGVDAIIHLAGANIANRWTKSYKQEIIESRVLSANLLFNILKKNPHQVKHIISASGTAIYPDSDTKIYNESETSIADGFLSNVVVKWEEGADQFKLLGIKVSKVRTGIVYSTDGGALVEILKPIKLGLGASFGTGKQIQSWIHINDVVNIYYFILKNNLEGTFNAVAPETISDEKLTKTIAQILKKPLFLPNIPRFIMQLILGDMCELLFTNKNISSQKVIDAGFQFQFPNINLALTDILKKKE